MQQTEANKKDYPVKFNALLKKLAGRKISVIDFVDKDFKISLFQTKTNTGGIFGAYEAQSANGERAAITNEQELFIDSVLDVAIYDYKNEKESLIPLQKLYLFNQVITLSCKHFDKMTYPDKNMVIACHTLATKYGGEPWDYLLMDIDRFLFNLHCLSVGSAEEVRQINKANNKRRGKTRA